MNIDEIDTAIFTLLSKNQKLTSSMLAKKIFHPKDSRELTNLNSMIYYRLHKLMEYHVIKETEKDGKKYYSLNSENIVLGKGFIYVKPRGVKRGKRLYYNKLFIFMDNEICHTIAF